MSGYYWKGRIRKTHQGPNEHEFLNTLNGAPVSGKNGNVWNLRNEAQVILSESHAPEYKTLRGAGRPKHKKHKPTTDIGGDFRSKKVEINLPSWEPTHLNRPSQGEHEEGVLVPSTEFSLIAGFLKFNPEPTTVLLRDQFLQLNALPYIADNILDAWGTNVISSVAPTNPIADLSTTLAEFISERKMFSVPGPKSDGWSAPGEYLNYQFGISPTVDFVKDLRHAIKTHDSIIQQYERNSGRWTRKSYAADPVITTTKTVNNLARAGWAGEGIVSPRNGSPGVLTKITRTETQFSFSGAFTYHLPPTGTVDGELARLDRLYGVKPGMDTVWELLPYSWLVDYKTNMGKRVQNIELFRQSGLVMPYAYVTAYQKRFVDYEWIGDLFKGSNTPVRTVLSGGIYSTTIQRKYATPFGFGISPGSLTAKQLSIVAALGLSRAGA